MQPVMAQGVPMSVAGGAQSTVGMAPPPMMHGQPIMYTGGPANAAPQYHVRNVKRKILFFSEKFSGVFRTFEESQIRNSVR